jgi:hypothetical protein
VRCVFIIGVEEGKERSKKVSMRARRGEGRKKVKKALASSKQVPAGGSVCGVHFVLVT